MTEEMILKEWEKAGGIYALAARLVREDLEKEKGEAATSPDPQTTQGKEV